MRSTNVSQAVLSNSGEQIIEMTDLAVLVKSNTISVFSEDKIHKYLQDTLIESKFNLEKGLGNVFDKNTYIDNNILKAKLELIDLNTIFVKLKDGKVGKVYYKTNWKEVLEKSEYGGRDARIGEIRVWAKNTGKPRYFKKMPSGDWKSFNPKQEVAVQKPALDLVLEDYEHLSIRHLKDSSLKSLFTERKKAVAEGQIERAQKLEQKIEEVNKIIKIKQNKPLQDIAPKEAKKQNVQLRFLGKLKILTPPSETINNIIQDVLNMSSQSAYRLLSGATKITLEQAEDLAEHYKVPFMEFLKQETSSVPSAAPALATKVKIKEQGSFSTEERTWVNNIIDKNPEIAEKITGKDLEDVTKEDFNQFFDKTGYVSDYATNMFDKIYSKLEFKPKLREEELGKIQGYVDNAKLYLHEEEKDFFTPVTWRNYAKKNIVNDTYLEEVERNLIAEGFIKNIS